MIEIVATNPADEDVRVSVSLFDQNHRPTKTLVGLLIADLAVDVCLGYAAFRVFKSINALKQR